MFKDIENFNKYDLYDNKYYLKLQDRTVAIIDYYDGSCKLLRPELLPFPLRGALKEYNKDDSISIMRKNDAVLGEFFYNRSLPISRQYAKWILNAVGIPQTENIAVKTKMMIFCKALSAADDYWITDDEKEIWESVSLRDNLLNEAISETALYGKNLIITGKARTPEFTCAGTYKKAWRKGPDGLYLFKGQDKSDRASEIEVSVSNIFDCFDLPHVKYELKKENGEIFCTCKSLCSEKYSIVDAFDAGLYLGRDMVKLEDYAMKTDPEMFSMMIQADYLISNRDRHYGNWGFFMDNETGHLKRIFPLFDHNRAFDKETMQDRNGGLCQPLPGYTQKEAAMLMARKVPIRCLRQINKKTFLDREHYESFIERAISIGLHVEREKNFWQIITGAAAKSS